MPGAICGGMSRRDQECANQKSAGCIQLLGPTSVCRRSGFQCAADHEPQLHRCLLLFFSKTKLQPQTVDIRCFRNSKQEVSSIHEVITNLSDSSHSRKRKFSFPAKDGEGKHKATCQADCTIGGLMVFTQLWTQWNSALTPKYPQIVLFWSEVKRSTQTGPKSE